MTTRLEDAPLVTDDGSGDDGDELDHEFCWCSEDIAFCGADVSGVEIIDADTVVPHPCVVCDQMHLCPRCGEVYP